MFFVLCFKPYTYIFQNFFLGHSSYNGTSYGFENESITSESTKYAARSTTSQQIVASKCIKVSVNFI